MTDYGYDCAMLLRFSWMRDTVKRPQDKHDHILMDNVIGGAVQVGACLVCNTVHLPAFFFRALWHRTAKHGRG
jgi:hypothetical protein